VAGCGGRFADQLMLDDAKAAAAAALETAVCPATAAQLAAAAGRYGAPRLARACEAVLAAGAKAAAPAPAEPGLQQA
jgi:hypothetical protein